MAEVTLTQQDVDGYRAELAALDAKGQRDGLTAAEVAALSSMRAVVGRADAAQRPAEPAAPAAPEVPDGLKATVDDESWGAFTKAHGRPPESTAELMIVQARTRANVSRVGSYGLTATPSPGRWL